MIKEIWVDGKLVETMKVDFTTSKSQKNIRFAEFMADKYQPKYNNNNNDKFMKTIYVKFWSPTEVGLPEDASEEDIKMYCFRAVKYPTEGLALIAYANTVCTYSTLLEEGANVDAFISEAYKHYVNHDVNWLEENFT